jgi:hypothetical protein
MSSRGELRKPVLAWAVLALALAACSSTPAGTTPSPAPTGAAQTSTGTGAPQSAADTVQPTPPSTAPPTVGSIGDLDICAMISVKEIESTTGFNVGAGHKLKEQSGTAGCQWDGTPSQAIQFVTISVFAFSEDAWFPPDAGDPTGEMVTGVGDEAYRKEIGLSGSAGDLVVKSGGLIVNITLFNDARKFKELHPQQVTLANLLISRL